VKTSAPNTEPLRDEQTAQICAPNGFLVASNEFGDLECRHEPVGQAAVGQGGID